MDEIKEALRKVRESVKKMEGVCQSIIALAEYHENHHHLNILDQRLQELATKAKEALGDTK